MRDSLLVTPVGLVVVGVTSRLGELSAPRVHSTVGRPREVSQKHQAVLEDIGGANPYVLDTVLIYFDRIQYSLRPCHAVVKIQD